MRAEERPLRREGLNVQSERELPMWTTLKLVTVNNPHHYLIMLRNSWPQYMRMVLCYLAALTFCGFISLWLHIRHLEIVSNPVTGEFGEVAQRAEQHYQKRVSFYMMDDVFAEYHTCTKKHEKELSAYGRQKHGGEVHFLQQLRHSPWRVFTMSPMPDLIIVPVHFGWIGEQTQNYWHLDLKGSTHLDGLGGQNLTGFHCVSEAVAALKIMQSTAVFKLQRSRNVCLMSTHFRASTLMHSICNDCIKITQVNDTQFARGACAVVAPMQSQLGGMKMTPEKSVYLRQQPFDEFIKRKHMFYFSGQCHCCNTTCSARRRLFEAGSVLNSTNAFEPKLSIFHAVRRYINPDKGNRTFLTMDPQYVARVSQTRFGLHVRGDTPTSNRLFDLVEAGTVPVIVSDRFFPDARPGLRIPWEEFTFAIPKRYWTSERMAKRMVSIASTPHLELKNMRAVMNQWSHRILWSLEGSLVAQTLLVDVAHSCLNVYHLRSHVPI